jgi:hypothetical protein
VLRYGTIEEVPVAPLRSRNKNPQAHRESQRFSVQCPVSFHSGESQGSGTLAEISIKGARIDDAVPCPEPGTTVLLLFAPLEGFFPIQLTAKVVRKSDNSFSVVFMNQQPRLAQWLELKGAQAAS